MPKRFSEDTSGVPGEISEGIPKRILEEIPRGIPEDPRNPRLSQAYSDAISHGI